MKIPYYECNSNVILSQYYIHLAYRKFYHQNLFKEICKSYGSEKVDGLILIRNKNKLFSIDYYNDGSWETFCLNGTVCSSKILLENKINIKKIITEFRKMQY